jgi:hypothetical protein
MQPFFRGELLHLGELLHYCAANQMAQWRQQERRLVAIKMNDRLCLADGEAEVRDLEYGLDYVDF